MNKVESAKNILKYEFDECRDAKYNIWGHSGTERKIFNYIFACVDNNVDISECKDWILNFFHEEEVADECGIKKCEWAIHSIYKYVDSHIQKQH
jgi:hypothetical protein